jgi:FMN reductase
MESQMESTDSVEPMNNSGQYQDAARPPQPLRLVAVSAGIGVPSSTRLLADRLAAATKSAAAESGRPAEVRVVELRDLATDIAHNMVTGFPSPALAEVLEAVTRADGLIAVTPIFTGSYSGLFKSFFDVMDNTALTGKPVLIAATGGTPRHSLALEHALRPLFAYLRTLVAPTAVYAASQDWGAEGDPHHDDLAARIARAGRELVGFVLCAPDGARSEFGPAADQADQADEDADDVVPFAQQLAALGQ